MIFCPFRPLESFSIFQKPWVLFRQNHAPALADHQSTTAFFNYNSPFNQSNQPQHCDTTKSHGSHSSHGYFIFLLYYPLVVLRIINTVRLFSNPSAIKTPSRPPSSTASHLALNAPIPARRCHPNVTVLETEAHLPPTILNPVQKHSPSINIIFGFAPTRGSSVWRILTALHFTGAL